MGEVGMSELSYDISGKFFDEILNIDKKIRFVAIYDGHFKAKYQKGIERLLREDEIKDSLSEAHHRWESRKKLVFKIGYPRYAMAQYNTVNRITIPVDDDRLIMVSTELSANIPELVERIQKTRDKFFGKLV